MMIKTFEEYVDKANKAESVSQLFETYTSVLEKHGLDRVLFALITNHNDIGQPAGVGVVHNFPSDWMSHYFEKKYDKIDPVPIYGANQIEAYKWEDIPKFLKLTKEQQNCLNYGQEAGLISGIATYLRAGNNKIAGVSLASSHKKYGFDGRVDLITAYSNHFYLRYRTLSRHKEETPLNIKLTEKEREILIWIANGKSNYDIGVIMTISTNTVDFHVRNILKKLETSSRLVAVVKAITLGIITI